jgi:hypothetical protein
MILIMDNITRIMTHIMIIPITWSILISIMVIMLTIQPMGMFITMRMDHITKLALIIIITTMITIITTIIIVVTIKLLHTIITITIIIMDIPLHIIVHAQLMLTALIIVHLQYQVHIIISHAVQL